MLTPIFGHVPLFCRNLATLIYQTIPAIGIAVSLSLLGGCEGPPAEADHAVNEQSNPVFSADVSVILERRLEMIRAHLKSDIIVNTVKDYNAGRENMSLEKVLEYDAEWRQSSDSSPFVTEYMSNSCATQLMKYQETDLGISEFFVTDARGMNVCQTNKTTDFYQADEQWWVESYNNGLGHAYYGQIEYDESAQTEAISIYVPVVDQHASHVIGVAKVVVDITSIKQEL